MNGKPSAAKWGGDVHHLMMRRAVFWIHLGVGVVAGLVIFVMSVTGVLLTYQRQITAWADRTSLQSEVSKRASLDDVFQTVGAGTLNVYNDPKKAWTAQVGKDVLVIDPATGAKTHEGSKKTRAFFTWMINCHRWLGAEGDQRPLGKAITGACNVGFLFLVVSGFYLWWPRNMKAFRSVIAFDRSAKGKARDWNWHNVVGFWSAIPLAVVVFTAMFFSYPKMTEYLYGVYGEKPPAAAPRPPEPKKEDAKTPPAIEAKGLDAAFAKAAAQVPGWKTISFKAPTAAAKQLVFTIDTGTGGQPQKKGTLTLNRETLAIEKWEPFSANSPARRARQWVRWLHTGEAFGLLGQTIAGLVSAGGAVLVYTGIAVAFRRFFRRASTPAVAGP